MKKNSVQKRAITLVKPKYRIKKSSIKRQLGCFLRQTSRKKVRDLNAVCDK